MARTARGGAGAAAAAAPAAPAPRVPTAEDFATTPQLAESPLEIPQLTFPDGTPFRVRVRARSARERAACSRAAVKAASAWGGTFDEDAWSIEAAFYMLAQPKLLPAQKEQLWDWNPHVIDLIVGTGVRLERLPARAVELELARLAGVAVPDAPGASAADRR